MEDFKNLAVGSIGLGSVHLLDVTAPIAVTDTAALFDAIVKLLIAAATIFSLLRKKSENGKQ